jgi:type IV secretion system protein VirD4
MSQSVSAPFWVRALVIALLCAAAVPAWLYGAGWILSLLLFHGHGAAPAATTWWDYCVAYHASPAMQRPLFLSGGISTALMLSPLLLVFMRPKPPLHGAARFATLAEIRRTGLLTNHGDGIVVGKRGSEYLVCGKEGFPHVMLAAPTGSGKGVGVVIPNLFNWNHSIIVLDIKKENWALTAGFRKEHGHAVFLFDPASPHRITHRWNPLAYVSEDLALRVDEIQSIGNILFPDIQGTDPIWTASCRSLFLGIVLYLFETQGKLRTLGQVGREVMSGKDKRFQKILDDAVVADKPYSDACSNTLTDYLNTSDNTRTSIRKTFTSRFELFVNPVIDAATSANDFDLTALRKRPTSIYLGITPNNLGRLAPLLNLFFQQVVDLNTRELPEHNAALTHQCLLLLDEFRSLGKMPLIVEAVACGATDFVCCRSFNRPRKSASFMARMRPTLFSTTSTRVSSTPRQTKKQRRPSAANWGHSPTVPRQDQNRSALEKDRLRRANRIIPALCYCRKRSRRSAMTKR